MEKEGSLEIQGGQLENLAVYCRASERREEGGGCAPQKSGPKFTKKF